MMTTLAASVDKTRVSYWWVFLLEGIAAILFGLALLFQPAATLWWR